MQNNRRWLVTCHAATIGIAALCVVLIGGWLAAFAQDPATGEGDEESMVNTSIYAELLTKSFGECLIELYVNDIPVTRVGGKTEPSAWVPVREFLVDGENSLTLVICPGPTPSTAKTATTCEWGQKADTAMEAIARLARLRDDVMAVPGAGEPLLELKWSGSGGEALPKIVTVAGDIGKQLGPWEWQSADILTLDDATRTSATEFINMIRTAYEKADPEPILAAGKIKNADAGRTYPEYGDGFFEEMVRGQLAEMKGTPEWKPSNLSVDQYDLRLVANGRMVEAIAKDWQPILRMANDDYRLWMLFGRINGEWQIMR